jgi:hypothetical protein
MRIVPFCGTGWAELCTELPGEGKPQFRIFVHNFVKTELRRDAQSRGLGRAQPCSRQAVVAV